MRITEIIDLIGQDNRYLFTSIAILSVVGMWINFSIGSQILGIAIAAIYVSINVVFIGQVLFSDQSTAFKLFYAFLTFFSFIVVLSTLTYWVFVSFSNLSLIAILVGLTASFSVFNRLSTRKIERRKNNVDLAQAPKWKIKLNLWLIVDLLVIAFIAISFYFLASIRTGESIVILDEIPSGFYISFFLACIFTLVKVFRERSHPAIVLTYLFFLILIPSSIYLVVLHNPYATNMMALNLEQVRWVSNFGRFVPDLTLPEAASSPLGRVILQAGWSLGMAALARISQLSAPSLGLLFTPIIFPLIVTIATFDLVRMVAPKSKVLPLFCVASFLVSQHNIFLFTPPGKPETLALGMLLVNIIFWLKFIQSGASKKSYLVASIITLLAIFMIHQYVGLIAFFIAGLSFLGGKVRSFGVSRVRTGISLILMFGLLVVFVSLFLPLNSITGGLTGNILNGVETRFWVLDTSKSMNLLFPSFQMDSNLSFFDYVLYIFVNNSKYFIYGFTVLGVFASFRLKLNRYWLSISGLSILLAASYMILSGNFLSDSYRFFFYLSFLSFPLIGVGLYWLFTELKSWFVFEYRDGLRRISLRPIQVAAIILASSLIFTSSVYAGLPRTDSMGYNWTNPAFPSDYDISALQFIKNQIQGNNGTYYVVGDAFTTTAGAMVLGYRTIQTAKGYVPDISFWSNKNLWPWATDDPFKYLTQGVEYTNGIADKTYIILTYRIPSQNLNQLIETYSSYFGNPVYSIEPKVYVFAYGKQTLGQIDYHLQSLLDDGKVMTSMWELQLIGKGNLNYTIRDDPEKNVSRLNSMEIAVTAGTYERATLRHVFNKTQDLSQSRYLLFNFCGSDSGKQFSITFRCQNPFIDYSYYTITDNSVGWKLFVIPLASFEVGGGSPSWSTVNEMLIQFQPGMPQGTWFVNQITAASVPPPDLVVAGNATLLP